MNSGLMQPNPPENEQSEFEKAWPDVFKRIDPDNFDYDSAEAGYLFCNEMWAKKVAALEQEVKEVVAWGKAYDEYDGDRTPPNVAVLGLEAKINGKK